MNIPHVETGQDMNDYFTVPQHDKTSTGTVIRFPTGKYGNTPVYLFEFKIADTLNGKQYTPPSFIRRMVLRILLGVTFSRYGD